MNEKNIFNLVSEEVFVQKFDELIKVLSIDSNESLRLVQNPNNPEQFIIVQNDIDVTQEIIALLLNEEVIEKLKQATAQVWGTF